MNLSPETLQLRRMKIAEFNQVRSMRYAAEARRLMGFYGAWLGWFLWGDRQNLAELIQQHQVLAEIHAYTARILMEIDT